MGRGGLPEEGSCVRALDSVERYLYSMLKQLDFPNLFCSVLTPA